MSRIVTEKRSARISVSQAEDRSGRTLQAIPELFLHIANEEGDELDPLHPDLGIAQTRLNDEGMVSELLLFIVEEHARSETLKVVDVERKRGITESRVRRLEERRRRRESKDMAERIERASRAHLE
jgi:hypothetical protein